MSLTESQHLKYNIKVDAKDSSFNTLVIPSLAFIPLNPESLLSHPLLPMLQISLFIWMSSALFKAEANAMTPYPLALLNVWVMTSSVCTIQAASDNYILWPARHFDVIRFGRSFNEKESPWMPYWTQYEKCACAFFPSHF